MGTVWKNSVEEAAWREKWCDRCFQGDEARKRVHDDGAGCPLLIIAARNVLPEQWKRRRNAVMGDTYICSSHLKRTAVLRKQEVIDETIPIFDIEPAERCLVPVDGLPDLPKGIGRL